jgi:hypothetical protein
MLCGLQRPIKNYDPSNYENEVYLITKTGKGRGRGFDTEYTPILGDGEFTPIIKNRILEIVRALYGKGIISEKELSEINPKKDATESFLDKVVSSALFELLTGTSEDSELKVKELSNLVEKLKSDVSKLDEAHIEQSQKQFETEFDYFNKLLLNDIINYVRARGVNLCGISEKTGVFRPSGHKAFLIDEKETNLKH